MISVPVGAQIRIAAEVTDLRRENREVELLRVWTAVPYQVVQKQWTRQTIPGYLIGRVERIDGVETLIQELIATDTVPHVPGAPAFEQLKPVFQPDMSPLLLRDLRFVIEDAALNYPLDAAIKFRILIRHHNSEVKTALLKDIEHRNPRPM